LTPERHRAGRQQISGILRRVFPGNVAQLNHQRAAFGLDADTKR
jgi:hypothetical protein